VQYLVNAPHGGVGGMDMPQEIEDPVDLAGFSRSMVRADSWALE
jgi:hypothetical protein